MDRPFLEVRWMDDRVEQFPLVGGSWRIDPRREVLIVKQGREQRDEIPLRNVRLYTVYPFC